MTGNQDEIVIAQTIVVPRARLQKLMQRYHIRRLMLFGSAARGELKPDSDIDLLVEFEDGEAPLLGDMVEIKEALGELFGGHEIDLATPSILNNPYRRRAIEGYGGTLCSLRSGMQLIFGTCCRRPRKSKACWMSAT